MPEETDGPVERDKLTYKAQKLRHDIVHTFPDGGVPEMSVLLGPLALRPGAMATYRLVYPLVEDRPAPKVAVRFVPKKSFARAIQCGARAPALTKWVLKQPVLVLEEQVERAEVPLTDDRPGRRIEAWSRRLGEGAPPPEVAVVEEQVLAFPTSPHEGMYVITVDCGPQPAGPWPDAPVERVIEPVFVYNREPSSFPAPGVDDLGELLRDAVNLSAKNGFLWFVHPIFFAEQYLNVKLAPAVRKEIALCDDLPDDLPAPDDQLLGLIYGRQLAGMNRICLDLEGGSEECVDSRPMAVQVDNPVDVARLFEEMKP